MKKIKNLGVAIILVFGSLNLASAFVPANPHMTNEARALLDFFTVYPGTIRFRSNTIIRYPGPEQPICCKIYGIHSRSMEYRHGIC
jgi:hypothetical protein